MEVSKQIKKYRLDEIEKNREVLTEWYVPGIFGESCGSTPGSVCKNKADY